MSLSDDRHLLQWAIIWTVVSIPMVPVVIYFKRLIPAIARVFPSSITLLISVGVPCLVACLWIAIQAAAFVFTIRSCANIEEDKLSMCGRTLLVIQLFTVILDCVIWYAEATR